MNVVVLSGVLAREPDERTLGSGDRVLSMDVTVRPPEGPATSVPVAWFGAPPGTSLRAGQGVVILGEARRRFFRTGAGTQSRTEVVVQHLVPAGDRRRRARLIERAVAALERTPPPVRHAGGRNR